MGIQQGDIVRVHYTGTLADGTVFDSSQGRDPLEFVMGSGQLIAGFEAAVDGRDAGESITVTIPAAEAYGESIAENMLEVALEDVPDEIKPEVGQILQIRTEQGTREVVVAAITDTTIVLDANHPLAGQALTFTIDIVDVTTSC